MARRRYVSTEISVDTRVNRLAQSHGDFAALLYTWMIPHADDQGQLTADPEQLLFTVLPGRRDKTADDVALAILGMLELGLLEADGDVLRYPKSFHKYQSYIKERRRESTQNSAEQRTSAQPVAPSSSPVSVPSPVSSSSPQEPQQGPEKPPPDAAVAAKGGSKPVSPLVGLSDGAREAVECWRSAHGKRSPPKLNPTQTAKLEKAVIELGLEWLRFGAKWSAERGIPEFDKAINAAYTARQNSENGSNGHGENRQHSGRAGAGSRGAPAGPGAGGAGEDDPFAKYVIRDPVPSGDPGSP